MTRRKKPEMRIYIGMYELLPEEHYGCEGVSSMTEEEVKVEITRQQQVLGPDNPKAMDSYTPEALVGEYTPGLFEETFNNDLRNGLNTSSYWIRMFN